jgi:hypothetical protein
MCKVVEPNVVRRDWETTRWSSVLASAEEKFGQAGVHSSAQDLVRRGLAQLIRQSSRQQSLKGILTAGVVKSISYGASKLAKARKK